MGRGIQESLFWSSAGVRFVWDGREVGVHWPARAVLSSVCIREYESVGVRARQAPDKLGERRPSVLAQSALEASELGVGALESGWLASAGSV